jgi:hypothetical protein
LTTQCIAKQLSLGGWGEGHRREVRVDFEGGQLSSDGGVPLLAELERQRRIVERFAACFVDHREPASTEHEVGALVGQRVFGLALGYEDLNDHEQLRSDPLLAAAVGLADPAGASRRCARDRGKPLAGKSTLQRLEAGAVVDARQDRYKRIAVDGAAVKRFFVEVFLSGRSEPSEPLILDLDATDDPVHGQQEGRFFHGYYGHYCYLPLYIFCGEALLWAQLRPSDIDASAGAVEAVAQVVGQIRERWPRVAIVLRGDSGFAREALMAWCEEQAVDYVFGLARNRRLERAVGAELQQAASRQGQSGEPERVFKDFSYQTRKSWSRTRRVVGKAEVLGKGPNPRFVVTSLPAEGLADAALYELYCQRGEMENRIKEQQLEMFADRTSSHWMAVNQLRLWFASVAYVLLAELRRLGLAGTELARAQCGTIRLKLLKIGARVRVTARRLWISLSSAYPYASLWRAIFLRLQALPPPTPA